MSIKNKRLKYNLEAISTTEILNIISQYHGTSLMEKMMDFCETEDIEPQYLGDLVAEDKAFRDLLYNDCVLSNSVKDHLMNKREKEMQELDIW